MCTKFNRILSIVQILCALGHLVCKQSCMYNERNTQDFDTHENKQQRQKQQQRWFVEKKTSNREQLSCDREIGQTIRDCAFHLICHSFQFLVVFFSFFFLFSCHLISVCVAGVGLSTLLIVYVIFFMLWKPPIFPPIIHILFMRRCN